MGDQGGKGREKVRQMHSSEVWLEDWQKFSHAAPLERTPVLEGTVSARGQTTCHGTISLISAALAVTYLVCDDLQAVVA